MTPKPADVFGIILPDTKYHRDMLRQVLWVFRQYFDSNSSVPKAVRDWAREIHKQLSD